MDQPEEILEKLERFNVQKNPEITRELDEYVSFVARTGESVFNWALVKKLYREKLINVITDFYNETPTKELPQYPNVDPFNYETMKKMLIERLDSFSAAPFTIQRISELLADPRKQYSRIDKFMRAVEKNILVVSTVSPGRNRSEESENGDSLDSVGLNGDFSSDVNVDIDMENDGSFTMTKEFNATTIRKEPSHDITTESQETITIKKVASKEEEASTSTIAPSNGEALEPTQTDITIENSSTVTITVCEPSEEPKSVIEEPTVIKTDEKAHVETIQKAEESVIKTDIQHEPITLLTESVEPKIDDVLLNEPLRPADDEILPENPETTPLAALENIVANRVEVVVEVTPRIEEQILPKQDVVEPKINDIEVTPKEVEKEVTEPEQKAENVPEIESMPTDDDSGIEAKRIRIESIEKVSEATNIAEEPKIAAVTVDESAEVIKEPAEVQLELKAVELVPDSTEIPAIDEPITVIEPVVEVKEIEDIPVAAEPIIETKEPESIPSPVIVEPTVIIEKPVIVPAAVEGEMEAVPINTENNMEDDISPAQIPQIQQEIPEMEMAQTANKMDTDDNEGENVLMDTDETEEPMDQ